MDWRRGSPGPCDPTGETGFRKGDVAYDCSVEFTVSGHAAVDTATTPFPKVLRKLEFAVYS